MHRKGLGNYAGTTAPITLVEDIKIMETQSFGLASSHLRLGTQPRAHVECLGVPGERYTFGARAFNRVFLNHLTMSSSKTARKTLGTLPHAAVTLLISKEGFLKFCTLCAFATNRGKLPPKLHLEIREILFLLWEPVGPEDSGEPIGNTFENLEPRANSTV